MPFTLIYQDITKLNVDVIVTSTNQYYRGKGLDRYIYDLCGEGLTDEIKKLGMLHLGEVRVTSSFALPCKALFHTSSPHWHHHSGFLERSLLGSCYRNSIMIAHLLGYKSIAFPLIASKGKHCPKQLALTVAYEAIKESLELYPDIDVILCLYGDSSENIANLVSIIGKEIEENYVPQEEPEKIEINEGRPSRKEFGIKEIISGKKIELEESFSEMLIRIINERGLKPSEVYARAGVSKQVYSNIISGKTNAKKITVYSFIIALSLNLEEAEEMLSKAGYSFSSSNMQDVVMKAFIKEKNYNKDTINDVLDQLDMELLSMN